MNNWVNELINECMNGEIKKERKIMDGARVQGTSRCNKFWEDIT